VATHDHHCPWVGNCIGERNKGKYYIYLWVQLTQVILGLCVASELEAMELKGEMEGVTETQSNLMGGYLAIDWVIMICIAGCLFLLILLHSYLASKALTSWEYFRWMKITYLKVWPKKYGSPFKRDTKVKNLMLMLKPRQSKCAIQWEMPKAFPKLVL
jgi:palmitoyltransferase